MWAHYAIWYLLPTAPPWAYLTRHSHIQVDAQLQTSSDLIQPGALQALLKGSDPTNTDDLPGNNLSDMPLVGTRINLLHREGAAFARVDALTGHSFFYKMFDGNPVPFGAFPSGHVTWPMCILLTAPPGGRSRFSLYVLLVVWATLYTSHHYLLDVIGAICVTVACSWLLHSLSERQAWRRLVGRTLCLWDCLNGKKPHPWKLIKAQYIINKNDVKNNNTSNGYVIVLDVVEL